ncbi:hypothetical protein UFOVP80_11 [uncultured Caudovirales phage]|jgi:hypothetical protein|uniref:Uncharacterized protein n=1 Tax=uncultured Caudovirales phage TaxID=2100421 RepID=A0A6J5KYW4_9CAUD|nr:hypothetical protein UFOVP80_11 [uncultured Caudovirales phage]
MGDDGYLFSKGLRDAMAEFKDMDIQDLMQNREFWTKIGLHGGMTQEQLDKIFKENDERAQKKE